MCLFVGRVRGDFVNPSVVGLCFTDLGQLNDGLWRSLVKLNGVACRCVASEVVNMLVMALNHISRCVLRSLSFMEVDHVYTNSLEGWR